MKDTIINAEHRLGPAKRFAARSLTALLWLLWAYLCLPVLSVLAWLAGVKLFYEEMLVREGVDKLFSLMLVYAIVIGVTSGLLILWARLNYRRFHNREKRHRAADATPDELAADYRLAAAELVAAQQMQTVTVHHSDRGHVVRIARR